MELKMTEYTFVTTLNFENVEAGDQFVAMLNFEIRDSDSL